MLGFSRESWAKLFRDGAWVFGSQIVSSLAQLAGIRILTELASPALFGETALWLGILTLSRNFFIVPLTMFLVRYHPEYQQTETLYAFLDRIRRVLNLGLIAMAIIGTVAYGIWVVWSGEPVRPVLLLLLLVMNQADAYRSFDQSELSAERRQRGMAIWSMLENWLVILFSAAALYATPIVESYLLGTAGAWVLCFFVFRIRRSKNAGREFNEGERSEFHDRFVSYSLPFIPMAIFSWILHTGNRYILGLHSTEVVGLFIASFSLANRPAIMASGVVSNVIRPILFRAESTGRFADARRIFLYWMALVAAIGTVIVAAIVVLHPWIIRGFLAPEFREGAAGVLIWTCIGYGIYALVNVVENRIMSLNRSSSLIVSVATGAILGLGLNYVLIPKYGSIGAAWATAGGFAAQFAVTVAMLLFVKHPAADPAANATTG